MFAFWYVKAFPEANNHWQSPRYVKKSRTDGKKWNNVYAKEQVSVVLNTGVRFYDQI